MANTGSAGRGILRTSVVATIIVAFRHSKARPAYCFQKDLPVFVAEQTQGIKPKLRRNPTHLALQWQRFIDPGVYASIADLFRKLGVSRARVTQVLRLLELPPEVLDTLAALGNPLASPIVTERGLRPLVALPPEEQWSRIECMVGQPGTTESDH